MRVKRTTKKNAANYYLSLLSVMYTNRYLLNAANIDQKTNQELQC